MMFEYHQAAKHDPAMIELLAAAAATRGGLRLRLYGTSMVPSIRSGEVVRVRAVAPGVLRRGDVVLCHGEGRLLAHRVLRLSAGSLITRGDTVRRADPPIEVSRVIGRVESVERHGRERSLITTGARRHARAMALVSGPYSFAFHAGLGLRRRALGRLTAWRGVRRLRRRFRPLAVAVRPGTPEDAGRLVPLLTDARPELPFAFAYEQARAALSAPAECLVAETPHTVVGWVVGRCETGSEWQLETLYVRQASRGLGAGSALTDAVIQRMRESGASWLIGPALQCPAVRRLLEARGLRGAGDRWEAPERAELAVG